MDLEKGDKFKAISKHTGKELKNGAVFEFDEMFTKRAMTEDDKVVKCEWIECYIPDKPIGKVSKKRPKGRPYQLFTKMWKFLQVK